MALPHALENDRIGPNAIIQVIESLSARVGLQITAEFFSAFGLENHLRERPRDMVAQRDVALLQRALRERFGEQAAAAIAWDAGLRTGDYLLANRIPRLAQAVLRRLPAALAARVLASAIAKHSWTFAGSGSFRVRPGRPFVLSIQGNPICSEIRAQQPACHYYAATFERIFRAIVHPNARVVETECESMGAPSCVFEVHL